MLRGGNQVVVSCDYKQRVKIFKVSDWFPARGKAVYEHCILTYGAGTISPTLVRRSRCGEMMGGPILLTFVNGH
jgi:hypothetical protein